MGGPRINLKTERGANTFPVKWFKEQQGYAVQGNHLLFAL